VSWAGSCAVGISDALGQLLGDQGELLTKLDGPYPDFGGAGPLMPYSTDLLVGFRRAVIYVGRNLRGEKPGNLPVEQASKFALIVNSGTEAPPPPTFVADEVIE
jgi:putative tryptophan/tyrosine transport system substrate-binding protein